MNNALAIDIGGTHFRVGLFDRQGRRLALSEGETLRSGGREWMLEEISRRTLTQVRHGKWVFELFWLSVTW